MFHINNEMNKGEGNVLSAGIEPTHMASEANALSTELGERIGYNENLGAGICQGFIARGVLFYLK